MARVGAALAIVYVVWGSTYLGIMVGIRTLPPLLMSSGRFVLAGGVLFLWAVHRGARPDARQWLASAVVGAALLFVGTGGITWAETRVDSGVAALLVAVVPVWIALLEWAVLRRPSGRRAVAGLALGIGGVGVLVGPGGVVEPLGAVVLLVASLTWAAGSLWAQRAPLPADPLLSAGMQMLAGGVLLGVAGATAGEASHLQVPSYESLVAFAYLVVVGSIVAFTAYAWLLRAVRPALVATHAYVNPAVAVVLGAVFLSEGVSTATLVAAAAIVAAVVLIVTSPPRAEKPVRVLVEREPAPVLERAA